MIVHDSDPGLYESSVRDHVVVYLGFNVGIIYTHRNYCHREKDMLIN